MNFFRIIAVSYIFFYLTVNLSAVDSPELIWRYATGGRITTSPVSDSSGTIYFGSEDRFLYALTRNGTLKWRLNLSDRITDTLATGPDGTIYTGSRGGYLIAINSMGYKIWEKKLEGKPFGPPAIDRDGTIFIVTDKGFLYSLSHTGFIHWKIELPNSPSISPVIADDLYIGLSDNRLYSYSKNGSLKWKFLLSGNAESIALSEKSIYVGTSNSTLVSIDYNGSRIWNLSFQSSNSRIIVLTNDSLICSFGGTVSFIDSPGNIVWQQNVSGTVTDLYGVSDIWIALNSFGTIGWYQLDGTLLGRMDGSVSEVNILSLDNGDLYLGSSDWLFYKYGFKGTVISGSSTFDWPSYRNNEKNDGLYIFKDNSDRIYNESDSNDYLYLMSLVKSLNPDNLKTVLDDIESRIYSDNLDRGKVYFSKILEYVASEGIKHPLYQDGILINNFPLIRARAIEILGITGTLETVNFLSDLLGYEWDNYCTYTIIKSLGYLQSDFNKEISESMVRMEGEFMETGNITLTTRYLLTVQRIFTYSGSVNPNMFNTILNIFMKSSSKTVKELALDTIHLIQGK